jgi:hypothetical protein
MDIRTCVHIHKLKYNLAKIIILVKKIHFAGNKIFLFNHSATRAALLKELIQKQRFYVSRINTNSTSVE